MHLFRFPKNIHAFGLPMAVEGIKAEVDDSDALIHDFA